MIMHNPPHPGEFINDVFLEPNGISGRALAETVNGGAQGEFPPIIGGFSRRPREAGQPIIGAGAPVGCDSVAYRRVPDTLEPIVMSDSLDHLEALRLATRRAVLEGPGRLAVSLRQAAARGEAPADLAPLLAKIRQKAYTITDADVAALMAADGPGYDQDQVFEFVVAATLGAAESRYIAAMAAVEAA